MTAAMKVVFMMLLVALISLMFHEHGIDGAVSEDTQKLIEEANMNGPYRGLVIPNLFEINPLLEHPNYTSTDFNIDIAGRRFRFGKIIEKKVILVMTGLSMFAEVWKWTLDELPLELNGDYTRSIGYIKFANYAINVTTCNSHDNLLNNVWYQPEEVFPVDGTPEQREHAFWVPVDSRYFNVSKSLEDLELEGCVNSTMCLSETPRVVQVERGTSASIYLDNAAYRGFIDDEFDVSPVDMESGAVALICLQQRVPFIIIRALSDLAGGGSTESNEADTFFSLPANNSVTVVIEFIKRLAATAPVSNY